MTSSRRKTLDDQIAKAAQEVCECLAERERRGDELGPDLAARLQAWQDAMIRRATLEPDPPAKPSPGAPVLREHPHSPRRRAAAATSRRLLRPRDDD